MKASTCVVALISLLLWSIAVPISCSTTYKDRVNQYIQCLTKHSQPSFPITRAIYTPHNSSFPDVFNAYARNLLFLDPKPPMPLLILTAQHESHVQAAIICGKSLDIMLKSRSGGHDMEGLSYVSQNVPFVLLDMFNLRDWSIDLANESMWVQSGATLGEIYYNIANQSKTHGFPAGLCPTLGLGGHISGGGFGTMVRKYGLATDNILDAKIVDAKGKILDRKGMGEDLFWAIKGGGGASFGVVLAWQLKLVKVPEIVTVIVYNRTTDQGATDLVHRWQQVSTNLSDDIFIRLELRAVGKTIKATFVGLFLGTSEQLLPMMKDSFPELGLEREHCREMSWIESTLFFYAFPKGTPVEALLNRKQNDRSYVKSKSDFVTQVISKEGLEVISKKMIKLQDPLMQWNPYGGIMSRIPSGQTPSPQRDGYLFKIQYLVDWHESGVKKQKLNLSRKLFDAMTPFVTSNPREAFLNYRDLDIGFSPYSNGTYEEAKVYGLKYFNKNFDRLVRVKTMVDPDNFFRNEQSIPVSHILNQVEWRLREA